MSSRLLIVITIILLPVVAIAQSAPDTLWVKKYGSCGMNGAYALLQNSDGGFTVLGTTTIRGAGGTDMMLVRTTASGDTTWTRTYGGTGNDNPADFATTIDGGFIIVASSTSLNDGHTHPYSLRVTAQGDTLWTRFLLTTQDGDYQSICRTGDGYMILGNTNNDVFLQKTDQNGDTVWSRFLGVAGNGRQLRSTADGGFVANGNRSGSMVSMKMDSVGNVLWYRAFRGGQSIGAAATIDGGVVSTGDGYGYFTGDRYDAAGNHVWSRTFGAYYNNGYCVVQTYDGSFVLGGYCNPNAEWSGVPCLYKTNDSGNVIWSDPFSYLYRGIIYRGIVTRDHGYAFIGWTNVGGNSQAFLIKLASDSSNIIPCPPTSLPFVDNFDSPTLDSCWTWIREDTSHWSLSERPGWMRLESNGNIHQPQSNTVRNILLRAIPASNLLVETKLDFTAGPTVGAGLIIYKDDDNFVDIMRIPITWPAPPAGIRSHNYVNNVGQNTEIMADWYRVYLRLLKFGNSYSSWASSDSTTWLLVGQWVNDLSVDSTVSCGLYAQDADQNLYLDEDFDYFRVDPLPGTNVCGNVSGEWDSTGSPYYVTCDVTVPAGQTLEIGPGVQVLFTGHYKFNVFGNLQAIGTESDSIVFTRAFPTEESKGWGVRFYNADPACRLVYSVVENCHATLGDPQTGSGGGIYMTGSSPSLYGCTIRGNQADYDGGGMACGWGSSPTIANSLIEDNVALNNAGGVLFHFNSNPLVTGCLIRNNSAAGIPGGGGIFCAFQSIVTFMNCTIAGNSTSNGPGGGLEQYASGTTTLSNCIVWGNTSPNSPGLHIDAGTITASYSDIQGGYPGIGNIATDPMFVDTANGDFHLQAGSPCIDVGDPGSPLDPDSTRADMGAFPYSHPNLIVYPRELDFGTIDFGTDSLMSLSFFNPTTQPIDVLSINSSEEAFFFVLSQLVGVVPPRNSREFQVNFEPDLLGVYVDTLVIHAQQPDSIIRIPLFGSADVILPPVDSLVIQKGPLNGIRLDWAAVTQSVSGQPVENVGYIIYGATSPEGPFVPFGFATTNSYVHPYVINNLPVYFYRVTADVGSSRSQTKQQ